MSNVWFDNAKNRARRLKRKLEDPRDINELDDLIDDIDRGVFVNEKHAYEQEMIAIRNPGFPGDIMGRPDDDFFDDDDDDVDEAKKDDKPK